MRLRVLGLLVMLAVLGCGSSSKAPSDRGVDARNERRAGAWCSEVSALTMDGRTDLTGEANTFQRVRRIKRRYADAILERCPGVTGIGIGKVRGSKVVNDPTVPPERAKRVSDAEKDHLISIYVQSPSCRPDSTLFLKGVRVRFVETGRLRRCDPFKGHPGKYIPVFIDVKASRSGLPRPPEVVGSKRDEEQLRRSERAYAERLWRKVPRLRRALERAGLRGLRVHRSRAGREVHPYLRGEATRQQIKRIKARSDVATIGRAVRATGILRLEDTVFVLETETDDGRRYALGGAGLLTSEGRRLAPGDRVTVEGYEWGGGSTYSAPGATTFVVRRLDEAAR